MNKKVLIAMPTMGSVKTECVESLFNLDTSGIDTLLATENRSLVYVARVNLLVTAMDNKCEYIFWVDSDMVFPPETLKVLMADVDKGIDMVTAVNFQRAFPTKPLLVRDVSDKGVDYMIDYPRDRLFEIGGCGLGCCVTRTSSILEIADTLQYNPFSPTPKLGEDYAFCSRMKQFNKRIFCDSKISTGHIGEIIYCEQMYKGENYDEERIGK